MATALHACYDIVSVTSDQLIIRDLCQGKSITNDAEHVVSELFARGALGARRLLYYDTESNLDELKHDGRGHFTGFAPGPR